MSNYIFAKLVWNVDPIYPSIRLIPLGSDRYSELPLILGEEINIRIEENKLCIGTEPKTGTWVTCVENQKKELGKNTSIIAIKENKVDSTSQCSLCRTTNFFTCRMTCVGDVCIPTTNKAKLKCNPPKTSVYLTHVGGEVKVGVSLGLPRRWLEQASDYAIEVAKVPGLIARRIEHEAAKKLSLKLQVRNTKKMRNLTPITLENAEFDLKSTFQEMLPIINQNIKSGEGYAINNPEFYDFTNYYGNLSFDRHIETIDPGPGVEFGGKIITVKGSIIVVNQGKYYFAMDTKKLISSTIELLDRPAKNKRVQAALDDWFE